MYSPTGTRALPRVSFLIRRSRDQRLVSVSPGLIAAAHVLHRLSVPRHPSCALVLLIRRTPVIDVAMEFSRSMRARARPTERCCARRAGTVSQNSAAWRRFSRTTACAAAGHRHVEVDVVLGEPDAGRTNPSTGPAPTAMNWRYP